MEEDRKEVSRSFKIDRKLLKKFKVQSRKSGKSYKRTIEESIQLWLNKHSEGCEDDEN